MTDEEKAILDIENEAAKFPINMLLIRDVFSFSFSETARISEEFSCNSDLFKVMERVKNFIAESDLPQEEKEEVIMLIDEETSVISFSQTTRCSVIAL